MDFCETILTLQARQFYTLRSVNLILRNFNQHHQKQKKNKRLGFFCCEEFGLTCLAGALGSDA